MGQVIIGIRNDENLPRHKDYKSRLKLLNTTESSGIYVITTILLFGRFDL